MFYPHYSTHLYCTRKVCVSYIQLYTGIYSCIQVYIAIYSYIYYIQLYTGIYSYIQVYTCIYMYIQLPAASGR